ncbi:MAG: hypothetical protein H6562_17445 [Lewinellaceae bacterium]|nr:hypothetical protein [Lewinella sp.]MCB9280681.1 hypothetical protein [Lewinellaceae bacterium]
MKFRLVDLEQYTGEKALLQGEAWYADGKVNHLREPERHLWTALIETGNGPVEVEAAISPTRLKAATCECAAFRESGECGHVTALLFAIRARQQAEKEKKAQRQPRKKGKSRLTTDTILEQADPDELSEFVRHFARHNRPFALALKAWFAPQVTLPGHETKYLELLESAISESRTNSGRISVRGSKLLYRLIGDMHLQARRNLELGHYSETAELCFAIIEKVSPLLRKMEDDDLQFLQIIRETFALIQSLAALEIPYDLQQKLFGLARDESRKLVYRNLQIDLLFFQFMADIASDGEQREILNSALEYQLDKYYYEGRDPVSLLLLKFKLLGPEPAEEELRAFIRSLSGFSKVLLSFCRRLKELGRRREAGLMAEIALEQIRSPEGRIELETLLMETSEYFGNRKKAAEYARSVFQATLDIAFYKKYGELGGKTVNLLKWLYDGTSDVAKRRALADILREENRREELLGLLQTFPTLEFLGAYGAAAADGYEDELFALTETTLLKHLQSHLGKVSSHRVRDVLIRLRQTGAERLAERLAEALKSAYPERASLLEALNQL